MTDKEIIQALRICATHKDKGCGLCPQRKYVRCTERLADEAITMIERLTAENAALREGARLGRAKRPQKIAYEKSIEFLRALTDGQSDEIKSLRRELEWKGMVIALAQRTQAKAEAERDALREKAPQWISVEDRLPEVWKNERTGELVNYIVRSPYFGVDIGNYHKEAGTWLCMGLPCTVTHWMSLPEAPEGGEKA